LHQVVEGQTPESIEKDYGLISGTVRAANRVGLLGLRPGEVLFLPGVAPRQLTGRMQDLFSRRNFFRSPIAGRYTSLLGKRVDPFTGAIRHHNGVDIKAQFNSLVAAAADGTVVLAGWNDGFGKCVIIDHAQGFRTLYGHLNEILVHVGQKVKQHQPIGRVGITGRTTGPHLHFTIWKDNKLQNPLNYLW
jgi:murein DD-endopeptidase MepM/ murein hydrolase activator NlpD